MGFRQSGNDRDEYVANNNGGFTIAYEPSQQMKPSSTYIAGYSRGFPTMGIEKPHNRNNAPSHTIIYRQNGTGRDTYILGNNGGFAVQSSLDQFRGHQEQFKRSLRQYIPEGNKFGTSITRFRNRMNKRVGSFDDSLQEEEAEAEIQLNKTELLEKRFRMSHNRNKSQGLTKATAKRIKDYLLQRDAILKAKKLNESLSQGSGKGRETSASQGQLFEMANSKKARSRNAPTQTDK